jgi:hypothetical protein
VLLTASEAAKLYGVTPNAINYWVTRFDIHGRWVIRYDSQARPVRVKVYPERDLAKAEKQTRKRPRRPRSGLSTS